LKHLAKKKAAKALIKAKKANKIANAHKTPAEIKAAKLAHAASKISNKAAKIQAKAGKPSSKDKKKHLKNALMKQKMINKGKHDAKVMVK